MTTTTASLQFVTALGNIQTQNVLESESGNRTLKFTVPAAGLYQLSLVLDAAAFDWEVLYQVLNVHNNVDQRTGPWDFRLHDAMPLVPSYWVWLDGKKIGLWYAQRVKLEDIASKKFRGRLAFELRNAGAHELMLEPFNPSAKLPWLAAVLESDPVDAMEPLPPMTGDPSQLPVAKWSEKSFWEEQKKKLATTHAKYQKPLNLVFDWALKLTDTQVELIAPLLVAHYMDNRPGAIERAVEIMRAYAAKPAWGREREDVYGHNGDIGGGSAVRCMAWAYHSLAPFISAEERKKLLEKLEYQIDAFMTQTLLMRDYWGGSLVQDHGWQAVFDLGCAALHLWGVTPQAERWLSFALPRLRTALNAAPPDGVIPASSYCLIFLYVHNPTWFRDALLARTGRDIIGHAALRHVPAFIANVAYEPEQAMFIADVGDRMPLIGGQATMAAIASKFNDAQAARIHDMLIDAPQVPFYHGGQMYGFYNGYLWGFFAYDPTVKPEPAPAKKRQHLICYENSGFVQYRDDETGVVLALRCGPWLGYHTHQRAPGPCDRMECSVGAGHCGLFVNGQSLICTPDTGYKIQSMLRSCLLINNHGQIGDTGYPMSIPSMPHRGEEIEMVRWNKETRSGFIRLNLTRCYPASAGVALYMRQFLFSPEKKIICRDQVILDKAMPLSWLFQHRSTSGCELQGLSATIGTGPKVQIAPAENALQLKASVARTPVVWSYASAAGGKPFNHVRYDTLEPTTTALIDFVFTW